MSIVYECVGYGNSGNALPTPQSQIESLQRALADANYATSQLRADLAKARAEIDRLTTHLKQAETQLRLWGGDQ